jgi:hypothetical protein
MLDQIMVAMIVVGQKCSSQSAFFEKQCIPVHVGILLRRSEITTSVSDEKCVHTGNVIDEEHRACLHARRH